MQGANGNNTLYTTPPVDLLWNDDAALMEIPRDSLKCIGRLGEGQFGEVHLCEVLPELLTIEDMGPNGQGARPALVAAKMLRPNASDQAR
jgi:discoidin domain receptor family protein 2